MNSKNEKISLSFEHQILVVKYHQDAVIDVADLKEIYAYAMDRANGKPYCVLFDAFGHYDVSDEAIDYISANPENKNIIAKAYILRTPESQMKTKLHLLFDHPSLKPSAFESRAEGLAFLAAARINAGFK